MKIFFGIVIGLAILIVLLLIIGLFINKDYSVAREIVINKPKTEVFNYLRLLRNQAKFSVWAAADPNMRTEFRGTDGEKGFVSAWDSDNKNVGKGEQEILKVIDGERIDYELRFLKPFKSTSWAYITTSAVDNNQTRVHWEFDGRMNYPSNLMLIFMNMGKMIGNDLDRGLQNLKSNLENS
jgi:hypothetical protein